MCGSAWVQDSDNNHAEAILILPQLEMSKRLAYQKQMKHGGSQVRNVYRSHDYLKYRIIKKTALI